MKIPSNLRFFANESTSQSGLSLPLIILLVIVTLVGLVLIVSISQFVVEQNALTPLAEVDTTTLREQREIDKLAAEIRQIRSDTAGSLFWMRLIAVFVTVGGAIGGFLLGQSRNTRMRLDFEQTKTVEEVYQSIIQKLSDESPLLRASAIVKLGTILREFPIEWRVSNDEINQRIEAQIVQHTKDVLANALAIEENTRVLKAITINLIKHRLVDDETGNPIPRPNSGDPYNDARGLDLSFAQAEDAYWAWTDFSGSDFFKAELSMTSFRGSILKYAQFREACLRKTVFKDSICEGTNFAHADLREADFSRASLKGVNFDGAKIAGAKFAEATIQDTSLDVMVNASTEEENEELVSLRDWLARGN